VKVNIHINQCHIFRRFLNIILKCKIQHFVLNNVIAYIMQCHCCAQFVRVCGCNLKNAPRDLARVRLGKKFANCASVISKSRSTFCKLRRLTNRAQHQHPQLVRMQVVLHVFVVMRFTSYGISCVTPVSHNQWQLCYRKIKYVVYSSLLLN